MEHPFRVRCKPPFRDPYPGEDEFPCYFDIDEDGMPYVYDETDGVKHVLTDDERRKLREQMAQR
jgi:hypothetical protein